ncbi:tRNA (adenine-N(1)-)-methyltransferase catalytic subunit trm61 [Vermiconidia calcicola]|uniref:tRNA (Adenine-N(1)-)-methyltransferase catalytic subunit trm61 n=1 Tax=Vermiconidia calcicola TaxID=1690605 RepID=A0ACC3MHP1_9PEZI|nr:tRNA (adenine-N(1)-)-methyltransferase catalytic subunit trm61 [Vermiconidia calcicola]
MSDAEHAPAGPAQTFIGKGLGWFLAIFIVAIILAAAIAGGDKKTTFGEGDFDLPSNATEGNSTSSVPNLLPKEADLKRTLIDTVGYQAEIPTHRHPKSTNWRIGHPCQDDRTRSPYLPFESEDSEGFAMASQIESSQQSSAAPLPREQIGPSPFFHTPPATEADALAILHLKRDSLLPITLRATADDGYAEGAVTNTRFGSFPHSTLIGLDWGSQVRASKVDTGTRGRKGKQKQQQGQNQDTAGNAATGSADGSTKKRKSEETSLTDDISEALTKKLKQLADGAQQVPTAVKAPIEAGSGFVHILPPTPESWTSSLDHRTQVVYTPDYSYILQRLRVRPGSTIIEAGAGSGSFTHAAARAVFNGYPDSTTSKKRKLGKVYSYEYHEPRVQTLRQELHDHGLDSIVELTHRDVCNEGFEVPEAPSPPKADAIFLDLPAPWLALKHLTRSNSGSPLNPSAAVHFCTFSPCIEQVISTVSFLRKNNWTEISMFEIQHKRLDVRRERVGLKEEGLRGVNAAAATVDEALQRLREVETKLSDFHANKDVANGRIEGKEKKIQSKAERLEKIRQDVESRKLYKEGNLVQRTEPEIKTHTSYLVFAVLPREWTEADEQACVENWPVGDVMAGKAENSGGKGGRQRSLSGGVSLI